MLKLLAIFILASASASFSHQKPKQSIENMMFTEIRETLLEAETILPKSTVEIRPKIIFSGKIESQPKKKQSLEKVFYFSLKAKK